MKLGYEVGYINYKQVLRSVNQLEIWSDILEQPFVQLEEKIRNTLRTDNSPNCWLSWGHIKYEYIVLNDFAYKQEFHGFTIFDAVRYKYNLSFSESVRFIYKKYILHSDNLPSNEVILPASKIYKQRDSFVSFTSKPFTNLDRKFWEPLEISSYSLKEDNVYSVAKYKFLSKTNNIVQVRPANLSYAYTFPSKHTKIYSPFSKYKWIADVDENDIGMYDSLIDHGSVLFINKSYKDARIQKNLFPDCGVVWVNGEGYTISDDMLAEFYQRFDYIYIYYDNDHTGITNAVTTASNANTLLSTTKFKPVWLPEKYLEYQYKHYYTGQSRKGVTDNADYIVNFGKKQLYNEINNML
jgi:hypothetical protein